MTSYFPPRVVVETLADLSGGDLGADVDLLPENFTVDFDGWVRVQAVLSADAVVKVKLNGQLGALNAGGVLSAGNLYEFDVTVSKGDKVNVQVSVAQTSVPIFRILKVVV